MKKTAEKKSPSRSSKPAPVPSTAIDAGTLPSEPDESPPTLHLLAHVAATIATQGEKSSVIAQRAMDLIIACQAQLFKRAWETAKIYAMHKPEEDRAFAFLGHFKRNEPVNLKAFLEVMIPGSKDGTRMAKWRAFRASCLPLDELIEGVSAMSKGEREEAGRMLLDQFIERDKKNGFSRSQALFELSEDFSAFLKRVQAGFNANRAKKSAEAIKANERMRLINPVAGAIMAGTPPTSAHMELLKTVTEEETLKAIVKLGMAPKQEGLWRAAIQAAKLPNSSRPKRGSTKKDFFSNDGKQGLRRATDCP